MRQVNDVRFGDWPWRGEAWRGGVAYLAYGEDLHIDGAHQVGRGDGEVGGVLVGTLERQEARLYGLEQRQQLADSGLRLGRRRVLALDRVAVAYEGVPCGGARRAHELSSGDY